MIIKSIKLFSKNKNHFNSIKKNFKSSIDENYNFKIEWPAKKIKINKRDRSISNVPYDKLLKIKKEDFIETFKNVLITLDYDVKLDKRFKEDQYNLGMEMLNDNSSDVIPLSSNSFKNVQTRDILKIGYEPNSDKLVLGKFETKLSKYINQTQNNDDEQCEEESEVGINLRYYQSKLIRFNEDQYPEEFKLIIEKFTEYLQNSKHKARSGLQYYNKTWNWLQIEMRKSLLNKDQMLIIDFNPQNLTENQIKSEINNVKQFFDEGPGKECNLTSLYFHILNPAKEIDDDNTEYNLLLGTPYISNQIDNKVFKFFGQNFYPDIFEVYEKLNVNLLNLIENSRRKNKTDIVVELDGTNGVLAALSKNHCKKFYTIQQYKHSALNIKQNVFSNDVESNENNYLKTFYRFSKWSAHMKTIFSENDENDRMCFVFQSFDKIMVKYESKAKKDLLIRLRKYPQIKTIILVCNLKTKFKIENYCYELMTGERVNKELFGEPFRATQAILIDSKPKSFHCNVVIFLERD